MRPNRIFFRAPSLTEIVRTSTFIAFAGMMTPTAIAQAPASAPKADPVATNAAPATPPKTADAGATKPDPRNVASFPPSPPAATPPSQLRGVREGRQVIDDELVDFSVSNQPIEAVIPNIFQWTGKFVFYKPADLANKKITFLGTKKIPKSQALDFIFQALKFEDLAVTETEDAIYIGQVSQQKKTQPGVVLGPDEEVMSMADNGLFVTKVYRLRQSKATDVLDRIEPLIPEEYAQLAADGDSNQLILSGDIGLAKKVQTLINMLDVPSWDDYTTETFRLQYQDASTIAAIIEDLFSDSGSSGGKSIGGQRAGGNNQRQQNRGVPQQPGIPGAQGGASANGLIVSTLQSMNSLTVRATPTVMAEIRRLVAKAWDLPPNSAGSIFRTYDLKYADPSKVRDLLGTLLGGGSSSSSNRQGQTQNRAFAGGRVPQLGGAQGGDGSPTAAVANIFSIEAYPDSNRLVVISKTPDNYEWLDRWIADLDQPFTSGLPVNVPLKHAGAVELSEILNTLLASSGSEGGGLRLPQEGIQGLGATFDSGNGGGSSSSSSSSSPFNPGSTGSSDQLRFPWQGTRAGQGAGSGPVSEVSGLIGRSRVVPNAEQNSVLVMAPPEVEKKVVEIIHELDKPGRQVMITAILAEVVVGDGFSWGARVGTGLSAPINGGDNSVGGSLSLDLTKGSATSGSSSNFASPWFDSSLLKISTGQDLGFFLQALSTDNSARILQQPRVFTRDNKEAKFVAGQDVTIQTGQTSGFGTTGTTSSFQQQFVGVGINVRPRITQDNNVAMEVEILLSNLTSATQNGNAVIDRRQTNTNVTVKDGQTIVISGIRREEETVLDRRLPFIGDIPLLGAAFSSTERQKRVVELMVFLVPVVVENPDSNDSNFNAAELDRLRKLEEPLDKSSKTMTEESQFFKDLKASKTLDAAPVTTTGSSSTTTTPPTAKP